MSRLSQLLEQEEKTLNDIVRARTVANYISTPLALISLIMLILQPGILWGILLLWNSGSIWASNNIIKAAKRRLAANDHFEKEEERKAKVKELYGE